MSRKDELLKIIGDNTLLIPVVDEIIFLENQIKIMQERAEREGGFFKHNPNNPELKKPDRDAERRYKDYSQLHDNKIRLIARVTDTGEGEEESPLRKWAKDRVENPAKSVKPTPLPVKRG